MNYKALLKISRQEVDAKMELMYHPSTRHLHTAERHARVLLAYLERITPEAPQEATNLVSWLS